MYPLMLCSVQASMVSKWMTLSYRKTDNENQTMLLIKSYQNPERSSLSSEHCSSGPWFDMCFDDGLFELWWDKNKWNALRGYNFMFSDAAMIITIIKQIWFQD